jgi:hypothetical protein
MSQPNLDETLALWEEAVEALAKAKLRESELRARLISIWSGGLTLDKGTQQVEVKSVKE